MELHRSMRNLLTHAMLFLLLAFPSCAAQLLSIEVTEELVVFSTSKDGLQNLECEDEVENKAWAFSLATYSGKAMYEMLLKVMDTTSKQIDVEGSGECALLDGVEQAISIKSPILQGLDDSKDASDSLSSLGLYMGDSVSRIGTVIGIEANDDKVFYLKNSASTSFFTYGTKVDPQYGFTLVNTIWFDDENCQGNVWIDDDYGGFDLIANESFNNGKYYRVIQQYAPTDRRVKSYFEGETCKNLSKTQRSVKSASEAEHPLCGSHLCLIKLEN